MWLHFVVSFSKPKIFPLASLLYLQNIVVRVGVAESKRLPPGYRVNKYTNKNTAYYHVVMQICVKVLTVFFFDEGY